MIVFCIGIFFGFVFTYITAFLRSYKLVNDKQLASARFCKKRNSWVVLGDLDSVYESVKHAKPGSVKYID